MYTLQSQDTPNLTRLYALIYASGCSIQRLAELQATGLRKRVVGAEIMTPVDIIVWTIIFTSPQWSDLTIPHGQDIDNSSLWFFKNGRQLNLGESRSHLSLSGGIFCSLSPQGWCMCLQSGLKVLKATVMLAMVMLAMMMVLVVVIMVAEALREVGWLHQHQH